MQAMVNSGQRMRRQESQKTRRNLAGETRSQAADKTADRKIAVPVADNQLNLKTAFSASSLGTTGGTRNTVSCKLGTGKLSEVTPAKALGALRGPPSSQALMCVS